MHKNNDMEQKYDIFISYSRQDKDKVLPIVEQIKNKVGVDCWIDMTGIESGEQFEDTIITAIDKCKIVLFMLSDNSLESDWTKREVYYAEGLGKRIVPILLNGGQLRGWFNFHFGNVDYIVFNNSDQKEKLFKDLRRWLGVKTLKLERIKHNNEFGFADESGRVIIPCQWKCAGNFSEGLAPVKCDKGDWGYIDETGKIVIPYRWIQAGIFCEGLARVEDINYKWGYIDKTGAVVIPCQWEMAKNFSNGQALVKDTNFKEGHIDRTGKIIKIIKNH